ncbi:NADPH-dependent FMN reductase [Arundinibacter roseus]|uniref:NADPH-dependent oxidoreductase n=1 Tax=Arundinibacter roseus TaxID=2070510 RepID=A0A4R4KHE9_9BACT|nr:NAD(P)H-dependent oxidoreductase [Arundinibacter roseus]TDB66019.1 NADPH-dependent oxidoreductase [Arundinibacter roseus]
MITIVVGTNRPLSKSREVANFYQTILESNQIDCQILDLVDLPPDFTTSALYANSGRNEAFNQMRARMDTSRKFIFVVPEYNNSYPGVFKAFIDGLSYPNSLIHKKCALVGLSDGVQGNALGLSHLTDVFNYLGMHVLAQKVRIPLMKKNFAEGQITDSFIRQLVNEQVKSLVDF